MKVSIEQFCYGISSLDSCTKRLEVCTIYRNKLARQYLCEFEAHFKLNNMILEIEYRFRSVLYFLCHEGLFNPIKGFEGGFYSFHKSHCYYCGRWRNQPANKLFPDFYNKTIKKLQMLFYFTQVNYEERDRGIDRYI